MHLHQTYAFTIELQQEAVQIAQLGKASLEESKKMAQERYKYYHSLYDENISALEASALAKSGKLSINRHKTKSILLGVSCRNRNC
ncbi:hypothetical protein [Xenorhabdus aichiensis]|uniref:hypothetical protein n=1 Tax=Xenorhabdus aichiensis TaxID=3025874 RepID=UPI00235A3763|nr:hypothetical protein [Xenorhabdus aichiensis]